MHAQLITPNSTTYCLQQQLAALGYYHHGLHGLFDSHTHSALNSYIADGGKIDIELPRNVVGPHEIKKWVEYISTQNPSLKEKCKHHPFPEQDFKAWKKAPRPPVWLHAR